MSARSNLWYIGMMKSNNLARFITLLICLSCCFISFKILSKDQSWTSKSYSPIQHFVRGSTSTLLDVSNVYFLRTGWPQMSSKLKNRLLGAGRKISFHDKFVTNRNVGINHETPDSLDDPNLRSVLYSTDYDKCIDNSTRVKFQSLKRAYSVWISLAKSLNIPYFIGFGTLLGYARTRDIIPYDHDIDVLVPYWAHSALLRYGSQLPIDLSQLSVPGGSGVDKMFLYVHPQYPFKGPYERGQYNCQGEVAQDGLCSFRTPVARIYNEHIFIDIFGGYHLPDLEVSTVFARNDEDAYWERLYHNRQLSQLNFSDPGSSNSSSSSSKVVDQGVGLESRVALGSFVFDELLSITSIKADHVLPLRRCTFLGIEAWCPYDYVSVLRSLYGPGLLSLTSDKRCNQKRGEWEEVPNHKNRLTTKQIVLGHILLNQYPKNTLIAKISRQQNIETFCRQEGAGQTSFLAICKMTH